MITSTFSPAFVTISVTSSRNHGESRLFTRVHNCVVPMSMVVATLINPARALSFSLIGMASSKLPSKMSTLGIVSGNFATIFSMCGGKKWMTRLGRKGISRKGSGAPAARGLKKSRAERTSVSVGAITGGAKSRRSRAHGEP